MEHLQPVGHVVYPVSPRIAARARERYRVAPVKDDRFDAYVLADTLGHEHASWRPPAVPSPLLAEIKALTRDRRRLVETPRATESQLRMILEAFHPAPARLFPGESPRKIGFRLVHELSREGIDVESACRVLDVSRSGYYDWRSRTASDRDWDDAVEVAKRIITASLVESQDLLERMQASSPTDR